MKNASSEFNEESLVEIAASEWQARIDRGLTAEEQDSYADWLTSDSAHREAMGRYQMDWEDFDRLAGIHLKAHARIDPDLLAPGHLPQSRSRRLVERIVRFSSIPLAALLALVFYMTLSNNEDSSGLKLQPALSLLARIEQRTLDDGSVIEINRGAVVEVAYTASERRVYLSKGEANFVVAKDPDRPFIVNVAGVDVKAVGTVFSIRLSDGEVDVIVTEGKVNVDPTALGSDLGENVLDAYLEIGQRGTVRLQDESLEVEVTALNDVQIEEAHLWQPRLLDYDRIMLGDIVREFNRSNPIQVVIGDQSLEGIGLSSTFWSDNVEGFVRLLESSFGIEAEWSGSREIVLRKAKN